MDETTPEDREASAVKPPFQFGLKHLLALPVGVALLFGSLAWLGPLGVLAVVVLCSIVFLLCYPGPKDVPCPLLRKYLSAALLWTILFVACVSLPHPLAFHGTVVFLLLSAGGCIALLAVGLFFRSVQWFVAGVGAGALMLGLVWPATGSRPVARRAQCRNNLKQIALALHNYHDTYRCLPPAYIADEKGRPMHSWRVLILPFLEQEALYRKYRFDEPWDGPNNRKLASTVLDVFNCPSQSDDPSTMTSYVVILGPSTAWPGDKSTRWRDFADGTSNTLLVVEVKGSGIHWMEPRDLHVVQMSPRVNPPAGQGISSAHPGGANVAWADGSVQFLPESMRRGDLKALLTIAGEELVDLNNLAR